MGISCGIQDIELRLRWWLLQVEWHVHLRADSAVWLSHTSSVWPWSGVPKSTFIWYICKWLTSRIWLLKKFDGLLEMAWTHSRWYRWVIVIILFTLLECTNRFLCPVVVLFQGFHCLGNGLHCFFLTLRWQKISHHHHLLLLSCKYWWP